MPGKKSAGVKVLRTPDYIIISRTDSIGDVVLTLPLASILKKRFPASRIIFLAREYTHAVINTCTAVDEFLERDTFLDPAYQPASKNGIIIHVFPVKKIAVAAKRKGIAGRLGTTNRLYHWWTCNKLIALSRKNSNLHEAQLNTALLKPLGILPAGSLEELTANLKLDKIVPLDSQHRSLLIPGKYHLILHPASQGSAREWGMENFIQLVRLLDSHRFQVFISGTANEKQQVQPLLEAVGTDVMDISGKMDLNQFIAFINACDGLVANSTGPLHIAAALGKDAMGIFAPMRPIHPGRWAPVGPHAKVFVLDKTCSDCRKNPKSCHCINEIRPEWVMSELVKRAATISS